MAQKIKVDTELVSTAGNDLSRKADEYYNTFDDLYKKATMEMSTTWQGKDYDEFRRMVESYKRHIDNLKKLLDNFSEHLKFSAQGYDKMVDINISAAKNLPK